MVLNLIDTRDPSKTFHDTSVNKVYTQTIKCRKSKISTEKLEGSGWGWVCRGRAVTREELGVLERVRELCSRYGGPVDDEVSGGSWGVSRRLGALQRHCGTLFEIGSTIGAGGSSPARGHHGKLGGTVGNYGRLGAGRHCGRLEDMQLAGGLGRGRAWG